MASAVHPRTVATATADREAWAIVMVMAAMGPALSVTNERLSFAWHGNALRSVAPDAPEAIVSWTRSGGWELCLPTGDPRYAVLDLWRPLCNARPDRPLAIGHLGQSIDGFIATPSGDSQFVTGQQNILHLHRLRALCSAVIVGAGTVAFDDPMLTTRHVAGPNPLRVIFDPARRLEGDYRLFTDPAASTLYACGRNHVRPGETHLGSALIVPLASEVPTEAATELVAHLRHRGCFRLFVEGGGVTVSTFLEAGQLDRLQIAIAPVIIGMGRPAIRLPAREALRDCTRPGYRVFTMGGDVLFDCDLRTTAALEPTADDAVTRVL